jgi:tetratricopeptide (TPR) repeat protein
MGKPLIAAAAGLVLAAAPLSAQIRTAAGLDSLVAVATADSTDPEAQYRLGRGYWEMRRYDDAERALRRAIAIDPHYASALFALGSLPYSRRPKLEKEAATGKVPPELTGVVAEARELQRRALMIDPFAWAGGSIGFTAMPARLRAPMTDEQAARLPLSLLWARSMHIAAMGEWDQALAELERVATLLETAEGHGHLPYVFNEVRYVMALMELRAGRSDIAAKRLEAVLAHDVSLHMAHARLADIHEAKGRLADAVIERRRALGGAPDDPVLLYQLGYALARAGSLPAADSALTRAMSLNPLNASIPRVAGMVRQTLGDTAGARSAYERFLAIAPSTRSRSVAEVRLKLAELD